jgi:hypothetical protein
MLSDFYASQDLASSKQFCLSPELKMSVNQIEILALMKNVTLQRVGDKNYSIMTPVFWLRLQNA